MLCYLTVVMISTNSFLVTIVSIYIHNYVLPKRELSILSNIYLYRWRETERKFAMADSTRSLVWSKAWVECWWQEQISTVMQVQVEHPVDKPFGKFHSLKRPVNVSQEVRKGQLLSIIIRGTFQYFKFIQRHSYSFLTSFFIAIHNSYIGNLCKKKCNNTSCIDVSKSFIDA